MKRHGFSAVPRRTSVDRRARARIMAPRHAGRVFKACAWLAVWAMTG
jgi:ribosomal protein L3